MLRLSPLCSRLYESSGSSRLHAPQIFMMEAVCFPPTHQPINSLSAVVSVRTTGVVARNGGRWMVGPCAQVKRLVRRRVNRSPPMASEPCFESAVSSSPLVECSRAAGSCRFRVTTLVSSRKLWLEPALFAKGGRQGRVPGGERRKVYDGPAALVDSGQRLSAGDATFYRPRREISENPKAP